MEIYFAEMRFKGKISKDLLDKIKEAIAPYKRINLVASVQYLDQINQIREEIKDKEFVVIKSKFRALYPGQILGCDTNAAKCEDCDAILSLTSGKFHVIGIMINQYKPIINVNIETGEIEKILPDERYRKRILQIIGLTLSAKKVMFILSTKPGQYYPYDKVAEFLKKKGIKVYYSVFDEIDFKRLNEFRDIDIFINTACQRISTDDADKIEKPIINVEDIEDYLVRNKMLG